MIVYGDCQAEAVAAVLGKDPSISNRLRVVYSRSYDHPVEGRSRLPDKVVADCAVLCEQHDPQGFRQRENLPEDCFTVKFPALDLNVLWPFNCPNPFNAPEPPVFPFGRFPYGDRVIVAAIDKGLPPGEILDCYLNRWNDYKPDLERLLLLERARVSARDTHCDVKMAERVLGQFEKRRLFWAINHPTNVLLEELIEGILGACGRINPLFVDADIASTLTNHFGPTGPLGAVNIPVHPRVAEHLRLEWYAPNETFRTWDGTRYSYEGYLEAMIAQSYALKERQAHSA